MDEIGLEENMLSRKTKIPTKVETKLWSEEALAVTWIEIKEMTHYTINETHRRKKNSASALVRPSDM